LAAAWAALLGIAPLGAAPELPPLTSVSGSPRLPGKFVWADLVTHDVAQAQREYAERDRDRDDVLEYAQRLASSPGTTDGLYWPPELNGETSPLGPLVAYAQGEGYTRKLPPDTPGQQPFHGYLLRILNGQGKHAPGGKYDYIINGNMIGGFALVAWPAEYRQSGVMTFIVGHQGRIYEQDLGPDTAKIATRMKVYDPGPAWQRCSD
jgi:hypothetical protein